MNSWQLSKNWGIETIPDEILGIAVVAHEISALVSGLIGALKQVNAIEPIWELSDKFSSVGRSVVQVHVEPEFFATFFNSSAGYRAMFRRGSQIGSATNAALVSAVRSALEMRLPETANAHVIRTGPKWVRREPIARSTLVRSLDPSLAKVWYSTAEVVPKGEIRLLPTGVSDRKLDVGLPEHWVEILQNPRDCIIEVKGAFVGSCGLFQIKDPQSRAHTLSNKGEA